MGKFLFISPGEIYVKPATQYHGGQILRHAQNQDLKMPKKTVPALIINFLQGKPTFVACFSPIQNLEHEYLFECLILLIEIIHNFGSLEFGVVKDDLSVYQKALNHFTRNTPQVQFA